MLAASYWSLLDPAIEMAEDSGLYGPFTFVPVSVGFLLGAGFVYAADILLPYLVRGGVVCCTVFNVCARHHRTTRMRVVLVAHAHW